MIIILIHNNDVKHVTHLLWKLYHKKNNDLWGYEWGCERRYHQQYDIWVYLNMWYTARYGSFNRIWFHNSTNLVTLF